MVVVNCTVGGCMEIKEVSNCDFNKNKTGNFYCKKHSKNRQVFVDCTVDGCMEKMEIVRYRLKRSKGDNFYCSRHAKSRRVVASCAYCGEQFEVVAYRKERSENLFCPKTNHHYLWMRGRKLSEEIKKKMSIGSTGIMHTEASKKKVSDAKYIGGGSYDHYAPLLFDEETRRDPDNHKRLQARCKFDNCKKWFTPTTTQCSHRLRGVDTGINYFYCSNECMGGCPVFRVHKYPRGMNLNGNRQEIVDPAFRKMVIKKDNHKCVRCETSKNLEVHHIEGIIINPMTANDIGNGITFCNDCHDWIHSQPGCYFSDYQRTNDCYSYASL